MARRTTKSETTRQQLLDAALAVIGRKGYSDASVDEIVKEAGVSKGVAYYHFKSKASMAQCVLERGIGRLLDQFEACAAEAETSARALGRMVELFALMVFENRAFGRFFVTELWREGRDWSGPMREYEARLVRVIVELLGRGQREGTVRQGIDLEFQAVAIIGVVLTTSLHYLTKVGEGGADLSAIAERDDALGQQEFAERIRDFVQHAVADDSTKACVL